MATLDRWRSFLEAPKTIELVHAEFVGRNGSPLLAGIGEIRMSSLQDFSYSVTATAGEPIEFFRAIEHKRQNTYDGTARLRLFGKDANGIEWSGGWTMPQRINFKPLLIEGKLTALDITDRLPTSAESTEMLFNADHLHPLARVMVVQKYKRLDILGSVIEFTRERATNVISITASHSSQLPPTYTERWLTQPLRIMFGQRVQPRLLARNIGREAIIFILAPPRLEIASWSAFWTDEASNVDSFFDCYSKLLTVIALDRNLSGEVHSITRLYDELAEVANASRWVMALTLAGCTEGLEKLLRPKMTADEFGEGESQSKEADELAEAIERLKGADGLKKRAIQAILQTKGASTARTLRALQRCGVITSEQYGAWNDIRHRVMHGNLVSPYSNEDEDNQFSHLVAIVRALTLELINRS
jgi:hypothetical protein